MYCVQFEAVQACFEVCSLESVCGSLVLTEEQVIH